MDRAEVRATVFAHLRGMVLAPVVRALFDRGVFEMFRDDPSIWIGLDTIVEKTRGNQGYLRVALRLLVSAGWLQMRTGEYGSAAYALTADAPVRLKVSPPFYREVVSFIPMAIFLEDFLFGKSQVSFLPMLQVLFDKAIAGWDSGVPSPLQLHLDGMLIGPAMVALSRKGIFDQLKDGPVELAQPWRVR